ncbi:hypothetical protein FRB91_011749 [Serendipita sp. 411]|nr:hypothetical protein FRC18_009595 [Serendipita sp. 400]KAG8857130.1 hypothetical protein FRB91_011749 [Serendipita sp. 411]
MCLRLFRKFVKSRVSPKRKGQMEPQEEGLIPKPTSAELTFEIGDGKALCSPPPITDSKVIGVFSEDTLISWDVLPFAEDEYASAEPVVIDPSKAYFSRLPPELKLEILDYFHRDMSVVSGKNSWNPRGRMIIPNREYVKDIKNLRICNRELAELCFGHLFAVVNLTPYRRRKQNFLSLFEQSMLSRVAPYVRYATVYLDDENEEIMARILRQMTNIRWLVFDCRLQSGPSIAVDVLCALSTVIHLTLYNLNPLTISTTESNIRLLKAFGNSLETLEISCDWYSPPPDELLTTIFKHAVCLRHFYIYSTRDTQIVERLVYGEWPSRVTLESIHLEECSEYEAWIVADMIRRYPRLQDLRVESCGGPGGYDNARIAGMHEQSLMVMKNLVPILRPPLRSFRIVHATDIEYRHMCRIPTRNLLVYDPLDQLLLGELLSKQECFPGMEKFEIQYLKEPEEDSTAAYDCLKKAVQQRGNCEFVDARAHYPPPSW